MALAVWFCALLNRLAITLSTRAADFDREDPTSSYIPAQPVVCGLEAAKRRHQLNFVFMPEARLAVAGVRVLFRHAA